VPCRCVRLLVCRFLSGGSFPAFHHLPQNCGFTLCHLLLERLHLPAWAVSLVLPCLPSAPAALGTPLHLPLHLYCSVLKRCICLSPFVLRLFYQNTISSFTCILWNSTVLFCSTDGSGTNNHTHHSPGRVIYLGAAILPACCLVRFTFAIHRFVLPFFTVSRLTCTTAPGICLRLRTYCLRFLFADKFWVIFVIKHYRSSFFSCRTPACLPCISLPSKTLRFSAFYLLHFVPIGTGPFSAITVVLLTFCRLPPACCQTVCTAVCSTFL